MFSYCIGLDIFIMLSFGVSFFFLFISRVFCFFYRNFLLIGRLKKNISYMSFCHQYASKNVRKLRKN